jgi:hypothetical protein
VTAANEPRLELEDLFARTDAQVEEFLAVNPVSCTKGCAGCCHQVVAIGLSEAIYIGRELVTWPNWRRWIDWLASRARQMTEPGVTSRSWFVRGLPCAFLGCGSLCQIYGRRPSACRYHFVRSPPQHCLPSSPEPHTLRYSVADQVAPHVVQADLPLWRDNPQLGEPAAAPLPLMVLFALGGVLTDPGDLEYVSECIRDLPSPQEWMARRADKPKGSSEEKT